MTSTDDVFSRVAATIEGVPVMNRSQGKRIFDHLVESGASSILEIGTAHGTSAAYMGAALKVLGKGQVVTLDSIHASYDPAPRDVLRRAGVADRVSAIRLPDASYVWWLSEQIKLSSSHTGVVEPHFDFCYFDGAHNFTIDGLAVMLVAHLLKPGAWLLMDDYLWTYASGNAGRFDRSQLSEAELHEPHVKRIVDTVILPDSSFSEIRIEDQSWVWLKKEPGGLRQVTEQYSDSVARRLARKVLKGRQ